MSEILWSPGSPSQGGNTGVISAVEGGGPQFEPVSPDEEDGPTLSGEETNSRFKYYEYSCTPAFLSSVLK